MVIAAVRRLVFKPARYAVPARYGKGHPADAIFLLALIAILMVADSFFAATHSAARAQEGFAVEPLAFLSLAWVVQKRSPFDSLANNLESPTRAPVCCTKRPFTS